MTNHPSGEPLNQIVPMASAYPIQPMMPGEGGLGFGAPINKDAHSNAFTLGSLLRFKWTIVTVFLVVSIPSLILVWSLLRPEYKAVGQVRVRPIIPQLVYKMEENGMIPLYQSYMNTQVAVIHSPVVLQRVLEMPEVRKSNWYLSPPSFKGGLSPLERLGADLMVSPRPGTELIDVSINTARPADASLLVNNILDEYIKYIREAADQTNDAIYQKLTEDYRSLENEIRGREKVLASLRKEVGTGTPENLVALRKMRLDEAESKLASIRKDISISQWQARQLETVVKGTRSGDSTTQPAEDAVETPGRVRYAADAEWQRLHMDAIRARYEAKVEQARLRENHPRMIELTRKAQIADEMLRTREKELDESGDYQAPLTSSGTPEAASVSTDPAVQLKELLQKIKQLQYEEQLAQNTIKELKGDFDQTFDSAQMLQREDESLRHKQEIFTAVRTRLEQKEMERNVPGSIEVLARALTPSEPFRDRRIMLTILSLVGSLGAGVGVAFLRGTFSQSIQEACDLTDTVSVPFLGQIPMVPSRLSPEDSPLVNESMRMVRTALTARMNSQKGCIVLVTSAGPGAGKSTVAAMLSKSFALSGKKVLLVDADMRNPTVSRRMGIEAAPGFVSVLTHELDDEQAILGTSTDRLWVLPTGSGRGGFDYELIANGTFKACVDRWRTKYDLIILDTPPILPVADTRILSRQVDGTIMVFREGNCRRGDVLDALASLASSGGKLMGTIFIGPCRRGTYGSAYYSHP